MYILVLCHESQTNLLYDEGMSEDAQESVTPRLSMHGPNERRQVPFCAIEYSPDDLTAAPTLENEVVLILLKLRGGHLRLLVHPVWRNFVRPEHIEYFEEILGDFRQRLRNDAEALFEQAKSLSVGPLVTHAVGPSIVEHPVLIKLCDGFRELMHTRRSGRRH